MTQTSLIESPPASSFLADARSDSVITASRRDVTKRHILTVGLEDWFQVGAFQRLIEKDQWYRFETRLEWTTHTTLDLLDAHNTKATFFVLGWIAERMPELIAEVADRGHEIASRGFYHRNIRDLTREEFCDDLARTREVLEAAAGHRVIGHRVADGWFGEDDLWTLDVLAKDGYAYDSSVLPMFRSFSGEPHRRFVHQHQADTGPIWEVPPSTANVLGCSVPIAGGNWFRQIPHTLLRRSVENWHRNFEHPFVMYFHTWELDPDQPRISAVDRVNKVRHYRNLDKMRWVLEDYLSRYEFGTVADRLGLELEPLVRAERQALRDERKSPVRIPSLDAQPSTLTPVSIAIPCYNEESTLPYLAKTLERLEFELGDAWRPQFVFVDDCSSDETWATMQSIFGGKSNCKLVRHEKNSGVSAGILTGIRSADHEIVASMDCDCSYDPLELKRMLPLLVDGVDLVTASPYHPDGKVKNVPGWRLLLSKGLSQMYRCVLPTRLHTWTSCFRVYRKSVVEKLPLVENGFLGTAEMVAQLSLRGSKIVEHPATLEVRIFGESKMKTARTIRDHLRLIAGIVRQRLFSKESVDSPQREADDTKSD